MNNKILNEVKRNRELMGINESELDEQGFIQGMKKGIEKGKEAIKSVVDKNDNEEEVKKYNNKPLDEIIQDVRDMDKSKGMIDVNGETLYFGVADSMSRETAKKKARNNAEIAAAEDLKMDVSALPNRVQRLTMGENNDYISYILISNIDVD